MRIACTEPSADFHTGEGVPVTGAPKSVCIVPRCPSSTTSGCSPRCAAPIAHAATAVDLPTPPFPVKSCTRRSRKSLCAASVIARGLGA